MASGRASPRNHPAQVEVVLLRVRLDPGHCTTNVLNGRRSGRINSVPVLHGDDAGPRSKERPKAPGRIRSVTTDPAASVDLDYDGRRSRRSYLIDVEMEVHRASRPRIRNRRSDSFGNTRIF